MINVSNFILLRPFEVMCTVKQNAAWMRPEAVWNSLLPQRSCTETMLHVDLASTHREKWEQHQPGVAPAKGGVFPFLGLVSVGSWYMVDYFRRAFISVAPLVKDQFEEGAWALSQTGLNLQMEKKVRPCLARLLIFRLSWPGMAERCALT